MEFQEVIRFWWRATARAFDDLRIKEQVIDGLTAIAITLIVAWIFTQGVRSIDWVKTLWVSFSGSPPDDWQKLIVAGGIALLINYIIQPAKMYKELGGFVDTPFKMTERDPVKDNRPASQARSGSITIENISPKFRIEDCFLTLDRILNEKGEDCLYSQQKRISWSSGLRDDPSDDKRVNREINIRPQEKVVADLVETQPDNTIIPTVWSTHPPLPIGKYEFYINGHGLFRGFEFTKPEVFIVEYEGKNKVLVSKKAVKQKPSI